MLQEFQTFLRDAHLLEGGERVLLAVSAGVDSVVMSDLFYQSQLPFDIVHCNFKLRGPDSDQDEQFVQQLADQYGVRCFTKSFATHECAQQHHVSLQMAARQLRYQWFNELLQEQEHVYVATAHHKNDALETMIFNLTRGTGLSGMHGIPIRQGQIIRPMLFADKQQIEHYATERRLRWREDSSNADDKYHRNLIRHQVVPVLEQINPSLSSSLESTLERFIGSEAIIKSSVKQVKKECVITKGRDAFVNLSKLRNLPGLNVFLHEILKDYNFQYHQARDIAKMLHEQDAATYTGKVFDSSTHRVNLDRQDMVISPVPRRSNAESCSIDEKEHIKQLEQFQLEIKVLDAHRYCIMPLANVAALDHEKLRFPLKLRRWQEGDFFYPLGMNCKKKLSDFMIDTKIPLNLKDRVYVLTSGEDIVWIVGYRIDHRYRVTGQTRQIYEVTQEMKV